MDADRVQSSSTELVTRAQGGDRLAFAELVRRHEQEVYTLAVRVVGDRELAADISQEALVRAWRGLPKFRGDAKFSTWLHRITVNTAYSTQRRWRRHRIEPLDRSFDTVAATGLGPEDVGVGSLLRVRLLAALDQLSHPVRSVVVLKDIYEWSHPEIAEHLGITVAAAKVRLHRGRKRLRALLDQELRER
jgi:RNA polymerase sigma-70 factor (ECF subfamily)